MTVANGAVPNFKSVLLVNSFSFVDQILEDALYKAIEQFQNCPVTRPEMCYNFLSVLLHSKQLTRKEIAEKFRVNPIPPKNRVHILQGCLNSINCKDLVRKI